MKVSRKRWIPIGSVIALYLGGFLILWLGGGYELSASGRMRLLGGLAVPDRAEWQPLMGWCQPEYQWPGTKDDWSGGDTKPRCDVIGWVYYPFWLAVKARNPAVELFDSSRRIPPEIEVSAGFDVHPCRGQSLRNMFEVVESPAKTRLRFRPDP
jgi:hypothetical protein